MALLTAAIRFAIGPLLVAAAESLFPGVRFGAWDRWVLVGITLASLEVVADMYLLPRLGALRSAVADAAGAAVVIWAAQWLLPGTSVSVGGALAAGVLIGAVESVLHLWMLRSQRRTGPT